MARGYVGVGGKARKLRAIFVGVNGKARSVKTVYVGVNGKARLCWKRPGIYKYTGTLPTLSVARSALGAATANDKYAIFAGGHTGSARSNVVDAYSIDLVRTNPMLLTTAVSNLFAGSIGDYAVFAGGLSGSASTSAKINAYNSSLTKTSLSKSLTTARYSGATAITGSGRGDDPKLLFAGGKNTTNNLSFSPKEEIYGLTRSLTYVGYSLPAATDSLAGAHVGEYAVFAGGALSGGNDTKSAYAYDYALIRTNLTNLSYAREDMAGGSVGNYAIFAGGTVFVSSIGTCSYGQTYTDAYDDSLTKVTIKSIPSQETLKCSMSLFNNSYVLFVGGYTRLNAATKSVVMYDKNLTQMRSSSYYMSYASYLHAATTIGNYAITAGGYDETNRLSTMDAWYYYDG